MEDGCDASGKRAPPTLAARPFARVLARWPLPRAARASTSGCWTSTQDQLNQLIERATILSRGVAWQLRLFRCSLVVEVKVDLIKRLHQ
jgi:hypothetical protein